MDEMTENERLRGLLIWLRDTYCGGSNAEMGRKIDTDSTYIHRLCLAPEAKGRRNVGTTIMNACKAAFDLPPGFWDAKLVEGAPEIPGFPTQVISDQTELAAHYTSGDSHLKRKKGGDIVISQFDTGGAMGAGVLLRDQPGTIQSWRVTPEWVEKNIKDHTGATNLCIVTGFGDSMKGMFNSGDPLIVDRGVKSVEYDAVYFFRVGEEGFIKRLQRVPGEGIRVLSKNKDYETWTVKEGMDFEVFGRVLRAWQGENY